MIAQAFDTALGVLGKDAVIRGSIVRVMFLADTIEIDSFGNRIHTHNPRIMLRQVEASLVEEGDALTVSEKSYVVNRISMNPEGPYATVELGTIRDSQRRDG